MSAGVPTGHGDPVDALAEHGGAHPCLASATPAPAPAAHSLLVQTLEQAIDGVVVIDERNEVVVFNAAAERIWGHPRDAVLGHDVRMLMPMEMRARHDANLHRHRVTGVNRIVGTEVEVPIECADGSRRQALMAVSQIRFEGRSLYCAFVRDNTQHRELLAHQRLLSTAVDESDIAMIVGGADQRIVFANAGCQRMFGYSLHEMVGQRLGDLLMGPHTDPATLQALTAAQDCGQQSFATELLAYTKDGRPLWVSTAVNPVHDAQGLVCNFVSVLTDITQTKLHEVLQFRVLDAMARETPMLDLMLLLCREVERTAPELIASILQVDDQGRLRTLAGPSLPPAYCAQIDGLPIGPVVGSCGTAAWRNAPVLVTDIATDPLWADFKGLALPLGLRACWSSPIRGGDGQVLGTFAFYYREPREPSALHRRLVDVSLHLCALILEREKTKAHIHQLAFYDTLTGLPNRALLRAKTERALHEAQRTGTPLAVLFVDLDRFKQVNDTHGHLVGDGLLVELAQRLRGVARAGDIIGRLSGDEFVAVLPDCGGSQAVAAVERLVAAVAQPMVVHGVALHPRASVGVALYPADGGDIDTLIRHADMAMYQAKTHERGSFRFFSAELNRQAHERAMLEADLREALGPAGGLALHYQPKVTAEAGRVCGVEALLRWQHPRLGAVPPLRFVALAEDCGLVHALGHWVLGEACRQMADWRARGVPVPHVAVNLSASNFLDASLPGVIAGLLQRHGLASGDLTVEMTESVMLNPDPVVLATVQAVHALGVKVSLDDFGTGYSSLSHLHRLPITELKLDRSFVQDIEHDPMARALTVSVLRIGKTLGLTVVAEGVETEAQRRFVADEGCPVVQGYLVSKPVPAEALEDWLQLKPTGAG
ncbi:EAL domain-containing protein [Aquincola tertiaricarbonis]|uniref:EAL domain-containing protein n=1 Tax=Aquincola tertiaricarbonis TaxID=391953 RepID=A0ABY4SEM4_AQUTE|nr:EAL domain-containing protein [Aquincola tertiaricarbonis]URI11776.1 EAL domain-containing protein [Aquincola tertiaricarbonis]